MEVTVKIVTTHNIGRHMTDEGRQWFNDNLRGEKTCADALFDKSSSDYFEIDEEESRIAYDGYAKIDFFRNYLTDDFLPPSFRLKNPGQGGYSANLDSLRQALEEDAPNHDYAELDSLFDPLSTYKLRISRNGFFHVIIKRNFVGDNCLEKAKAFLDLQLNAPLSDIIPLFLADLFITGIGKIIPKSNGAAVFLESFYHDELFRKKMVKGIMPHHATYAVVDTVTDEGETLHSVDGFVRKMFRKTDIFQIEGNRREIVINSKNKIRYNDNICFVYSKGKRPEEEEIIVRSFIRTFEHVFSLATEFETIRKETTRLLEGIAKTNQLISAGKQDVIAKEAEKEIMQLTMGLSQCYRMLPHLRDFLVGSVVFKNFEVITVVQQISEVFQLNSLEAWIKKNIEEMNTLITYFQTLKAQARERRTSTIFSGIILFLSILQVPSFLTDIHQTKFGLGQTILGLTGVGIVLAIGAYRLLKR